MFGTARGFEQLLGTWGILAVGVVAGIMVAPCLRKGARRLAVSATRGMLTITDEAKKLTTEAKGQLDKLVTEARAVETAVLVAED